MSTKAEAAVLKAEKLEPIYDRALVKRCKNVTDTTAGGIHIPETHRNPQMEAIVISVGTGRIGEDGTVYPLVIKKGQKILMGMYAGTAVEIDDEEFIIIREEEILAIVHDEA